MNSSQEPNQSLFNQASTSIQACIECMFACKHCASACLQEEHVHMMREHQTLLNLCRNLSVMHIFRIKTFRTC